MEIFNIVFTRTRDRANPMPNLQDRNSLDFQETIARR